MTIWLLRLASLRLTAVLLMVLVVVTVGVLRGLLGPADAYPVPLLLMAANLVASVLTHPGFRGNLLLLIFHLALAAVAVLAAVGQLTHLSGHVEVTQGERLDPSAIAFEAGPLHRESLDQHTFLNAGFEIDYAPGLQRRRTRNAVFWRKAGGGERQAIIGDHVPLRLGRYRYYTTHNKGLAPVLRWVPKDGKESTREVFHLPGYPIFEDAQEGFFPVPGGTSYAPDGQLHFRLELDEPAIDPERASTFGRPAPGALVVRVGGREVRVTRNEPLRLPEGTLRYDELRNAMGYAVVSEGTLPWLYAAAVLAGLSMLLMWLDQFRRTPWRTAEGTLDGS